MVAVSVGIHFGGPRNDVCDAENRGPDLRPPTHKTFIKNFKQFMRRELSVWINSKYILTFSHHRYLEAETCRYSNNKSYKTQRYSTVCFMSILSLGFLLLV